MSHSQFKIDPPIPQKLYTYTCRVSKEVYLGPPNRHMRSRRLTWATLFRDMLLAPSAVGMKLANGSSRGGGGHPIRDDPSHATTKNRWNGRKKKGKKGGTAPVSRCEVCGIFTTGQTAMDSHLKGAPHQRKLAAVSVAGRAKNMYSYSTAGPSGVDVAEPASSAGHAASASLKYGSVEKCNKGLKNSAQLSTPSVHVQPHSAVQIQSGNGELRRSNSLGKRPSRDTDTIPRRSRSGEDGSQRESDRRADASNKPPGMSSKNRKAAVTEKRLSAQVGEKSAPGTRAAPPAKGRPRDSSDSILSNPIPSSPPRTSLHSPPLKPFSPGELSPPLRRNSSPRSPPSPSNGRHSKYSDHSRATLQPGSRSRAEPYSPPRARYRSYSPPPYSRKHRYSPPPYSRGRDPSPPRSRRREYSPPHHDLSTPSRAYSPQSRLYCSRRHSPPRERNPYDNARCSPPRRERASMRREHPYYSDSRLPDRSPRPSAAIDSPSHPQAKATDDQSSVPVRAREADEMSVGKRKREFEPVPRKACVALTGARKLAEGASNDDPRHSKTSLHEASADGSQRRKLRDMEEERALRECRASANKKPRQSPRMPAGPSDTLRAVENHTSHPTTSNGGLPRVQLPRGNDANSTPASVAGGGIGGNCSVIPREYLEGKISLAELCEFRHHLLLNGNDVDKLAFRILQELLLSPNLGLREDLVGPFSNAMTKATVNQYVSDKGEVCVSMQDIPELLKCRDPTVEHVYQTEQMGDVRGDVWDEGWERSKSEEDRALTMMHENIVYLFRSHDHIDSKDQLAKALNIFRGDTWKQVLNPQGFVPLDRHGQAVMARKHDDICRNDVLLGNLRESLLHRNNEYERVTAGGEGNLHARAPLSCTPSAEGGAEMERYKQSVRG